MATGWHQIVRHLNLYYVEPRLLDRFVADDPWTGRANVAWLLALYMLSESITGPEAASTHARRHKKNDLPGPDARDFAFSEVLALEREDDPAHPIFLPHALARVWQRGECPAASLPRVLRALQPRLMWTDYRFADLMTGGWRYRFGLVSFAVLALICVLLSATFRPPGFANAGPFLLQLALLPAATVPGLYFFRRWLLRRRSRLEALFFHAFSA